MLPNRVIIYMYMISRYCWPVRIDWAIFIPFFMKKCQKIQSFSFITCNGIDLLFITPASPLTSGRLVIRYWPGPSGICDKCRTKFRYFVTFQDLPENFHATNCDWLTPWKGYFCPWGPCNNVVRLGGIFGYWTDIESNTAHHGWVCHAVVMKRRRDSSFLTLASTLSIKQNGGFLQECWMESTPQLPGSGFQDICFGNWWFSREENRSIWGIPLTFTI